MEEKDFVDAILDDPVDDMLPLVFADWLEEDGQPDRAGWVRATCSPSRIGEDGLGQLLAVSHQVVETWKRCRPAWWKMASLSGVEERFERGMMSLEASSMTSVRRLGRSGWISRAIGGGWLGWITVNLDQESAARVLLGWEEPARQYPLHLRVAPLPEDLVVELYQLPRLIKLELGGWALNSPATLRLVDRPGLRSLSMQIGLGLFQTPATPSVVSALMDRVGRLDCLRSLALHGPRPNHGDPAFLSSLGEMAGLRSLTLVDWPDLTIADLSRLDRLPGLRRLRLEDCPGATDHGLHRLREALPSLHVEQARS